MSILQKAFDEALLDAPYQAVAAKVSERLAAQGVVLSGRELDRLTEHLRSDSDEVFRFRRWRWWEDREVSVEVTEADIQGIHDRFMEFLDGGLSELIVSATDDLSTDILRTLRRTWRSESRRQDRERRGFEKRLHQRWGPAIDRLQMCLVVSRELGESISSSLRSAPDFASPHLLDVLTRLHARACQTTDEIVRLLEAGFADGAMARWRTLHEIAVVAFFLKEHGEELAIRYVDHQVVESFRAASDYRHCSERLGYEPMEESEYEEIRRTYEERVQHYGTPFKTQYGWAADALSKGQPTLRDIEEAAGIDHLRAHYRMASHNVHANPRGVFFKLGLFDEVDILLAGPSNAGLADPGHGAAISLMHVSTALGLIEPSVDSLVGLKILARLVDEVGDCFQEAHMKLQEDVGCQRCPKFDPPAMLES